MRVIRCDRCSEERHIDGSQTPPHWLTVHAGVPDGKTYELCPRCADALREWLAPPGPPDPIVPASQQLLPVDMPIEGSITEIPMPAMPTLITDEDIPF